MNGRNETPPILEREDYGGDDTRSPPDSPMQNVNGYTSNGHMNGVHVNGVNGRNRVNGGLNRNGVHMNGVANRIARRDENNRVVRREGDEDYFGEFDDNLKSEADRDEDDGDEGDDEEEDNSCDDETEVMDEEMDFNEYEHDLMKELQMDRSQKSEANETVNEVEDDNSVSSGRESDEALWQMMKADIKYKYHPRRPKWDEAQNEGEFYEHHESWAAVVPHFEDFILIGRPGQVSFAQNSKDFMIDPPSEEENDGKNNNEKSDSMSGNTESLKDDNSYMSLDDMSNNDRSVPETRSLDDFKLSEMENCSTRDHSVTI
ncbi:unnamed protein product [Caenorhabditis bovis]|uniref:Uncharacterized protein n=1 Tax=Caenorhabditis bovis TaxID=2654633 RepID=A0A8S1EIC5_9PELO|nr:unnamed protein product [Caenorhabditis bovis]